MIVALFDVFKISINNGLPLLLVPIPQPWLLTVILSNEVRLNDAEYGSGTTAIKNAHSPDDVSLVEVAPHYLSLRLTVVPVNCCSMNCCRFTVVRRNVVR